MSDTLLIPPAIADERRRDRRIHVRIPVELAAGHDPQVARITELSRQGARIEAAQPLGVGTKVAIRRGDVALEAVAMWSRGTAAGLRLVQPLNEREFLKLRRSA